jgi:tRNA (guanine-N7-)-methyltransferase
VRTRAHDLLQEPLEWSQIAPSQSPVELEIGSGKGHFLQTAAQQRPAHFFVGIELAAKFANQAADRLNRQSLPNAVIYRGDAQSFLQKIVPDAGLMAIHVYFPDPWWRNRHKKRRVLNEQALQDIYRTLQPGGRLHFWTDVLDYYEHICGQIMELTPLTGPGFVPQRAAMHSMDYTTHFERRARNHGQAVYRATFDKPATET